jgi:hypothetical protein
VPRKKGFALVESASLLFCEELNGAGEQARLKEIDERHWVQGKKLG